MVVLKTSQFTNYKVPSRINWLLRAETSIGDLYSIIKYIQLW